jgi:acetylornithine deacetylase
VISREEIRDLTASLVAIESVNPDLVAGGAGEAEIARFVAGWLRDSGLDAEVIELGPGRANVVAVVRGTGGGRSLMLNAHMDTVGVGGMGEPFTPRVEGERLHGRGAFDMKASLATIMLVAREAQSWRARGDLIVTAVADEEFASIGVQDVVRRMTADAAIVTEPFGLDLCVAHKGFVWLDVETFGVASHGSLPEAGSDAIASMGPVLTGVAALDRRLQAGNGHPLLGTGSIHASLIEGGQELSTYPARCVLSIERRTIPGETRDLVEAEMQTILDEASASDPTFRAELRTLLVRDAFEVSVDEPIVAVTRKHLELAKGGPVTMTGAGGWMDSAFLSSAGIPTVIFGPDGEGAHADVEWVDLVSAAKAANALLGVAREFCA